MVAHAKHASFHNALQTAIQTSRRKLQPFRRNRKALIEQYVGNLYADEGAPREVYINLIQQAAGVYAQTLSGAQPKFLINTQHQPLRPFALRFAQALNHLVEEIKLLPTLRQIVIDAFFSIGLAKVYVADAGQIEVETNIWMDPGRPFVKRISVDNYVCDMTADSKAEMLFEGDAYRVPLESLSDNEHFDKSVVREMTPTSKYDGGEDDRASAISGAGHVDDDELEPMVDLLDVWLPRQHRLQTYALDRTEANWSLRAKPLLDIEWDGPERGPYHRLMLGEVPDNSMATSPASNLRHLHDLVNSTMRKLAQQIERQKSFTAYSGENVDDMKRIIEVKDGGTVKTESNSKVESISMGGIDQLSAAFLESLIDKFDRQAGNLSARLGLGPSADTLGQEQMIGQEIASTEKSMIDQVNVFVAGIGEDVGHLLWNDPTKTIPGQITVPGTNYSVDNSWTPEQREGDLWQFNFDVEPFSLQFRSPAERMNSLLGIIERVIAPLAQQLEGQGGRIDVQELVAIAADLTDTPRIKGVVKFDRPPELERPGPAGGNGERPLQSPTTHRTYTRRNVPTGGTPESRSITRQQALLGTQPTPQNQNALAQPVAQ